MDEPTGTQVPSMFLNFLGSSIDWGYRTEPESAACLGENERRCNWPRGKVIPQTLLFLKKRKTNLYRFSTSNNDCATTKLS